MDPMNFHVSLQLMGCQGGVVLMDNSLRCGLYMFVCYALEKVVRIWYSE